MISSVILQEGAAKVVKAITRKGVCLVREFIEEYPDAGERKKILRQIKDLADNGPHPSRERFRVIENDMFELKSYKIRILGFFLPDNVMLLTHGCKKKKDDLDPQEIARAYHLFNDYKARLKVKGAQK